MRYTVELDDDARAVRSNLSPKPKSDVNRVIHRLTKGPDRRLDLRLAGAENQYRAYAGRRWRVIFSVLPGRKIRITRISRRLDAYEGIEHPGPQDVREPDVAYEREESSVPAAAAD